MFKATPIIRVGGDVRPNLDSTFDFGIDAIIEEEYETKPTITTSLRREKSQQYESKNPSFIRGASTSISRTGLNSWNTNMTSVPSFHLDTQEMSLQRLGSSAVQQASPRSPVSALNDQTHFTFMMKFTRADERDQYTEYLFSIIREGENALNEMEFKIAYLKFDSALSSILEYWTQTSKVPQIMNIMPKIFLLSIDAHVEDDDYNGAIQVGYDFQREFPNDLKPYQVLCYCLRLSKQYEKAIQVCNRALEIFPDENSLYSIRANIYYDRKEYKHALRDFHHSTEISRVICGEAATHRKFLKTWLRETVF